MDIRNLDAESLQKTIDDAAIKAQQEACTAIENQADVLKKEIAAARAATGTLADYARLMRESIFAVAPVPFYEALSGADHAS
jgi:hypothetical protein